MERTDSVSETEPMTVPLDDECFQTDAIVFMPPLPPPSVFTPTPPATPSSTPTPTPFLRPGQPFEIASNRAALSNEDVFHHTFHAKWTKSNTEYFSKKAEQLRQKLGQENVQRILQFPEQDQVRDDEDE